MRLRFLVTVAALCAAAPGFAQEPTRLAATGLYLGNGSGGFAPATQLTTTVAIDVSGIVARVTVAQSFRNDSPDWLEGIYVFPLPDDAAVDTLRMRIGERRIEGEIQEREAARQSYERARAAGQQASLVEQERPNLFTTSVANIAPYQEIAIEIAYLATATYEQGEFALRFPMTLTPRFVPGGQAVPGTRPDAGSGFDSGSGAGRDSVTTAVPDASRITPPVLDPTGPMRHLATITLSLDAGDTLVELASRSHPTVSRGRGNPYTLTPAAGAVPMDRDFLVHWRFTPGREPRTLSFTETVNGEEYVLLMLLPPATAVLSEPTPRELIFIIDTSGSMGGASIEQATAALHTGLDRLGRQDRFNIIAFDSNARALYPSPAPWSVAGISEAHRFVAALRADGGTNMAPAIAAALAGTTAPGYLRQIVFVTDGSVGNEDGLFRMIADRLGNARLFTVGIGSAPNTHFMRKAAQFGRGTYLHIADTAEVESGMQGLFDKIGHVALQQIELAWPAAAEAYPDRVPDLYFGEPVVLAAKLGPRTAAGIGVEARGQSGSVPWSQHVVLSPQDSAGIASVWARRKIESLLDQRLEGATEEVIRPQVLQTALAHGLLSPYTSLVAVDRTPALTRSAALRREAVGHMLPAGSAVDAQYASFAATATSSRLFQLAGVLLTGLMLGLLGIWRLSRKLPL